MDFGRSPGCQSVIVTSAGMALSLGLAWQGLFGEIDRKTINRSKIPLATLSSSLCQVLIQGFGSERPGRYSSDLADSEWKSRDSEI